MRNKSMNKYYIARQCRFPSTTLDSDGRITTIWWYSPSKKRGIYQLKLAKIKEDKDNIIIFHDKEKVIYRDDFGIYRCISKVPIKDVQLYKHFGRNKVILHELTH